MRVTRAGLVVLFFAACTAPPPVGASTTVRFAPGDGATPLDYGDVPFPSDLYLDDAGRLALGALPTRRTDEAFFVALRTLLAERDGSCTTCSLHVYFDGALDPASLPASATPSGVALPTDPIVLVDLDATPPRYFPLRLWYDAERGHLALRPVRGHVLAPRHRFALAITSALRAADGSPVSASEEFTAILDGRDTTHASTTVAIDALAVAGLDRSTLVSVTTFTTSTTGGELAQLRSALHATPAPAIVVDRVYPGPDGTLDDLFGTPSEDRPGLDVPPAAGTEGSRSVAHDAIGTVILGRLSAPRVITGEGTELGTPLLDASGAPTAGVAEDVPFALAIPRDTTSLAELPVLFVHHGFSETRASALFVSNTAARAGYATFTIDAFLHGGRAIGATDDVHNLRGSPGPDGMFEGDSGITRLFAVSGTPSGMALFPTYLLGTFSQFAADAMSSVRFLREGDLAPVEAAVPSLEGLSFDGDHIAYAGVSMGTVVGASVLAAEPDVRAAVMFVPLGGLIDVLCEGAGFRPLATTAFATTLGVSGPFDEIHRSCVGDPIFDLERWGMEPIDPLALASHWLDAPPRPGAPPDVLWILASNDEAAAPPAAESMLASIAVAGVGRFRSAPLIEALLPASGNHASGATAVAISFEPATHGLPEYRAGTTHYALPLEPPFVSMDGTLENPVADVHARVETFLRTALVGHARVE